MTCATGAKVDLIITSHNRPETMQSPSAQERVLWTTDTLEPVLLQLDVQTLLLAQRTCRLWHLLIHTSPAIQKALFYLADHNQRPVQNPLLAKVFPSFFPHPVTGETDANFTFMNFDTVQNPDKIIAYNRRRASWRRMFVQQPPPLNFVLVEYCSDHRNGHVQRKIIRPKDDTGKTDVHGVRMEVLYQFVVTNGPLRFETDHYHQMYWRTGAGASMTTHPWTGKSEVVEVLQQTLAQVDLVVYSKRPTISRCRSRDPRDRGAEEKRRRLIMPHWVSPVGNQLLYDMVNWEG
ncbi:hypothetical protein N7492_003732 [Penicillium capsulatum]|uniref:F-box domain-containing protein n=1 Tax=Penicillium capsulatum TaxID=69766 RepID=A0A9W9IMM5_9EURO|nr:hypothetical protein N7492_003732 [Penicillium capsulatum]